MKKIFLVLIAITLITPVYADKLLKNGFLNKKMNYAKEQNINDPTNKIILIYNHGQDDHDEPSKNCVWKNGIRNFSSLVGEKINGKRCYRIGINNGERWKEPVKNYQDMDMTDCFQYYNPTIKDYIASRTK